MASLTPVDGDPFADGTAQPAPLPGQILTPVDHDPFADNADTAKAQARAQADTEAQAGRELWHKMDQPLGVPVVSPLAAYDMIRNLGRGQLWGSYIDEALAGISAGANKLTGGAIGKPYDQAVEAQRAENRASDVENPVAGPVTRVAGGFLGGAPIAKKVMEGGNLLWRTAKGAGVGGTAGAVYGFGEGEGSLEDRIEKATEGAEFGAPFGAVLPGVGKAAGYAGSAIRDYAAPMLARTRANLAGTTLARKYGFPSMSADAGAAPEDIGANAAAEQVLADRLLREGMTVDQVREELSAHDVARELNPGSTAQSALALPDIVPAWQRELGASMRVSDKAATTSGKFQTARQTGLRPASGELPAEMGLPTRRMLARPMTAEDAVAKWGTDFDAGSGNVVPMGQFERLMDATKRAFLIKDSDYHGHAANSYKTEQQIVADAQEAAKPNYAAFHAAGQGTDDEVRGALAPIIAEWRTRVPYYPEEAQNALNGVLKAAEGATKPLPPIVPSGNEEPAIAPSVAERFDKAKQFAIDPVIDNLINSREGRNRALGHELNELKGQLVGAIDNIKTNGLGEAYAKARNDFSSRMEARDALLAGAEAGRDDANAGVDAYNAITGEGNRKLFRLGLVGTLERKGGKRATDATQIFQTHNMQQLLSHIVPRTETSTGRVAMRGGRPAAYSDRPERLGQYILDQQRMIATRNATIGGSQTAERIAEDEASDALSHVAERMKEGAAAAAGGGDWIVSLARMVMIPQMWNGIVRSLGMRQDTAAAIARMLSTANRGNIEQTLANIQMRMGRNRFERLKQIMSEYQAQTLRTGTVQGMTGNEEQP